MLEPDGRSRITRAGRSPGQQFATPELFAEFLVETFEEYAEDAKPIAALPLHGEFALALNVASCDSKPLAVLCAKSEKQLAKLEQRLAALAWTPEHAGLQHYVRVVDEDLPEAFADLELEPGLTLLEPDAFAVSAEVLGHVALDASPLELAEGLVAARAKHDPAAKERRSHARDARREGITWDSELPVTDGKDSKDERRKPR